MRKILLGTVASVFLFSAGTSEAAVWTDMWSATNTVMSNAKIQLSNLSVAINSLSSFLLQVQSNLISRGTKNSNLSNAISKLNTAIKTLQNIQGKKQTITTGSVNLGTVNTNIASATKYLRNLDPNMFADANQNTLSKIVSKLEEFASAQLNAPSNWDQKTMSGRLVKLTATVGDLVSVLNDFGAPLEDQGMLQQGSVENIDPTYSQPSMDIDDVSNLQQQIQLLQQQLALAQQAQQQTGQLTDQQPTLNNVLTNSVGTQTPASDAQQTNTVSNTTTIRRSRR